MLYLFHGVPFIKIYFHWKGRYYREKGKQKDLTSQTQMVTVARTELI